MKILIAGAGGFAKELLQIIEDAGLNCVGMLVPSGTSHEQYVMGVQVFEESPEIFADESLSIVLGMGHAGARRKAASIIPRERIIGISHPTAIVGRTSNPRAHLNEDGIVLGIRTTITENAKLGYGCMLNMHVIVSHDASIGPFSILSPNVTLCGDAHVGEGCEIGTGATILPGIRVGNWVTIGAGAVVTEDIPDNAIAVGVPARIINVRPAGWQLQ